MKIVTVLKTGGDFDREYVERIAESVPKCYEFVCLSDDPRVPGYVPLKFNYPGWWSKMEMFCPGVINDSIFYIDLDTIITGDISPELARLEKCKQVVMLSDFYEPAELASGVMYIPYYSKSYVWSGWTSNEPDNVMSMFRGDQDFLRLFDDHFLRFDEGLPNWICSYKAHVVKTYPKHLNPLPVDHTKSKIVCFHGKPRPRDVNWRLPDVV